MPFKYDLETDIRYLQGFKIGYEKGLENVRRQRIEEMNIEMALKMLKEGLSVNDIANFSNLSIEKVKELQKQLEK